MEPVEVYVGAGSNCDPERNLRSAVAVLKNQYGELRISSVYETPPIGCGGAHFLNFVLGFLTTQAPREVMDTLRAIEYQHGRRHDARRQSPFPLDLDILLYGDLVSYEQGMEIPCEDIDSRAFVLGPLAELIPNQRHPVSGLSYAELWQAFPHTDADMRLVAFSWDTAATRQTPDQYS
jgi:2-amino-4-hydroxy-6-hydroxymethyldihydropteridine diphosphokinase